jgi:hypothetical protein
MDNFLDTFDLLHLNQEDIKKSKQSIMSNEIENMNKESPSKEKASSA